MLVDVSVVVLHHRLHEPIHLFRKTQPFFGGAVAAEVGDADMDEVGVHGRFHMRKSQSDLIHFALFGFRKDT